MIAKIYSTKVNGVFTRLKAYHRRNAINAFLEMDASINPNNVFELPVISNQTPIDRP